MQLPLSPDFGRQVTLFQPGWQIMPTTLLLAPPPGFSDLPTTLTQTHCASLEQHEAVSFRCMYSSLAVSLGKFLVIYGSPRDAGSIIPVNF